MHVKYISKSVKYMEFKLMIVSGSKYINITLYLCYGATYYRLLTRKYLAIKHKVSRES
jgi:hypothetical protein